MLQKLLIYYSFAHTQNYFPEYLKQAQDEGRRVFVWSALDDTPDQTKVELMAFLRQGSQATVLYSPEDPYQYFKWVQSLAGFDNVHVKCHRTAKLRHVLATWFNFR